MIDKNEAIERKGNIDVTASIFRIGYAVLLLICIGVWWLDREKWFSDAGVLTAETADRITGHFRWSFSMVRLSTPSLVSAVLLTLAGQTVLLLLGIGSRFQAACIFLWLVLIQDRNPLICDGEDTVFRLFAFYMIFMPLDDVWSLGRFLKRRLSTAAGDGGSKAAVLTGSDADRRPTFDWGLRLIQIQMTLIYLSASVSKLGGKSWRDGSAMLYVFRMDDHMGRSLLPNRLFDAAWFVKSLTWSSLAVEMLLPFALWYPRTRLAAVVVGIGFHLAIEANLNFFLFEWIMILGLTTFIPFNSNKKSEPGDDRHRAERTLP